ncbi:MAG TPA: DUF423 domain-containing protein [Planctomycetota bacterium]|nr:DUF423 domain-containing protein [Planctomycetota bacterium]
MHGPFAVLGALSGAIVVLTGAFGAHGLRNTLDARALDVWEKAVHWQAAHAVALLLVAVAQQMERDSPLGRPRLLRAAGWAFVAGTVLFSGSLYALALTDVKALGAVTPVGGLAFVVGWLALAAAAWPRRP